MVQCLGVEGHLKNAAPAEVVLNDKNETVPDPTFITWKDKDHLLKSWMTNTLFEEALFYVAGCNAARDV